jgi:hypothetical protein
MVFLACLGGTCSGGLAQEAPAFSWKQGEEALALMNGKAIVWQYNHKKAEGKPYFHPLSTVDGEVLTWLRPKDHPWHRGLWHSWKFINGRNYWEEDRKTGLSKGRTEITRITITTNRFSAHIKLSLRYHPPNKPDVMREQRELVIHPPDQNGNYAIDWTATYTATKGDVKLDRTPLKGEPRGRSWGGYAGLSARMAKSTRGWTFVNSDQLTNQGLIGKPAKWVLAFGKTPGGKDAGLAFMDHPDNLRHPSPWYLAKGMPYFSPAVLYRGPYTLKKGASLTFRYRVLVESGPTDHNRIETEWKAFRQHKHATK